MAERGGFFITIEGIEGSGKSSLITSLHEWLAANRGTVTVTREPGGTPLGKEIRNILLNHSGEPISQLAELLLFSADRVQHVEQVLRPALNAGNIVLCDRYVHSTLAYQGSARGLAEPILKTVLFLSTGGLQPDLVLLLDLDPVVGLGRARKRTADPQDGDSWSRFEAEELSFHQAVRKGFLDLAAKEPGRFAVIDASKSAAEVFLAAQKILEERFSC